MPDSSAKASAVSPAANATDRRTGTGFAGCATFTRRTAHHHQAPATAMPRVGSGSKVQPSRSVAADGGWAGAGPWAATDVAAASQLIAPNPIIGPTPPRSFWRTVIVRIVARTPAASRAETATLRVSWRRSDPSGGSAAISLTGE